jgi:hypothetical protein
VPATLQEQAVAFIIHNEKVNQDQLMKLPLPVMEVLLKEIEEYYLGDEFTEFINHVKDLQDCNF